MQQFELNPNSSFVFPLVFSFYRCGGRCPYGNSVCLCVCASVSLCLKLSIVRCLTCGGVGLVPNRRVDVSRSTSSCASADEDVCGGFGESSEKSARLSVLLVADGQLSDGLHGRANVVQFVVRRRGYKSHVGEIRSIRSIREGNAHSRPSAGKDNNHRHSSVGYCQSEWKSSQHLFVSANFAFTCGLFFGLFFFFFAVDESFVGRTRELSSSAKYTCGNGFDRAKKNNSYRKLYPYILSSERRT